ncbi:MAG: hypothetical protein ABI920_02040 [Casimicrobiaceae bacterium]
MKRITHLLLPLALAGCQTIGPTWSELSGARFHMAVADRRPVMIVRVDNESTPLHGKVQIAPGRHEIVVESFRHGYFRSGYQEKLTLDVAPCRRYYINAQYRNSVQPRFEAVVDEVEPIAGCRPGLG